MTVLKETIGGTLESNGCSDEPHEGKIPFRTRLRACRSFLLTPGSRPDTFIGGRTAGADAVMVDLESNVAPGDKPRARKTALTWLREPASADVVRIVRINSPRSAEGLRDLLALHESSARPDAIVIAKCESADEIRVVADVLEHHDRARHRRFAAGLKKRVLGQTCVRGRRAAIR
jgi:citrate lyase beta subunit